MKPKGEKISHIVDHKIYKALNLNGSSLKFELLNVSKKANIQPKMRKREIGLHCLISA